MRPRSYVIRSILYIGVGALLGMVAVASIYAYEHFVPSEFDTNLALVSECVWEENAPLCAQPYIESLLALKSGAEVMDALSETVTPQQCHYIGHVVGQQSYRQLQSIDDALRQCNRMCDSACVHGVIGEAFAEALGVAPDNREELDLRHISVEELEIVGESLCDSPETCHGVGHALFQIFSEFEPALELCRAITGEEPLFCYQGMFMEYADVLYSRNMRPVQDTKYPAVESLATLCNFPTMEERRPCFRYYPRMVVATLTREGRTTQQALGQLRNLCRAQPRLEDRIACIGGLGVYTSYSVLRNSNDAVRNCERFPALIDEAACHVGQVSVATKDREEQVIAYCSAISNVSMRAGCYQAVFYFLDLLEEFPVDVQTLCKSEPLCISGAENHTRDPWKEIEKRDRSPVKVD